MRLVIQRVTAASVAIEGKIKSEIGRGLLVFVGIGNDDDKPDVAYLSQKLVNLRIFDDENGIMNRSVLDMQYDILIVSQFTLHARTRKGNRPSYVDAAKPDVSIPLYEKFCSEVAALLQKPVGTGEFGACMQITLTNDGPVTIWMDSKET